MTQVKAPGRDYEYGTRLVCRVRGCSRPAMVRKHGLCLAHYTRYRRDGAVGSAKIRARRTLTPFGTPKKAT